MERPAVFFHGVRVVWDEEDPAQDSAGICVCASRLWCNLCHAPVEPGCGWHYGEQALTEREPG